MDKKSLPIVIFVIVCIGLYMYSDTKNAFYDPMTSQQNESSPNVYGPEPAATMQQQPQQPSGYDVKGTVSAHDLLPKDINSDWAKLNPVGSSNATVGGDFLDAKAFMGQISQYKGIMNYDLRAFPVIEKREVSPWIQSTFEPDVNHTGIQCTN